MVVKVCNRENQVPSNRNENAKRGLRTPSKSFKKCPIKIIGSPRVPLGSSSLTNINNNSDNKVSLQLSTTPIKQEAVTPHKDLLPPSGILTPITSEKCENRRNHSSSSSDSSDESCLIDTESICSTPSAGGSCKSHPPVSRRNARERNRVKQVSMGFAILRQHVPQGNRKKKLSKVETLRSAVEYIRNLKNLLQEHPMGHSSSGQLPPQMNHKGQSFITTLGNIELEPSVNYPQPSQQPLQHQPVYYDDRLIHQQHLNASSCSPTSDVLESHVLKIPKIENQQQYVSQIYSTNIFNPPSGMTFLKTSPPQSMPDGAQIYLDVDKIPESSQLHYGVPLKDTPDVDLLDALDWWQQNV